MMLPRKVRTCVARAPVAGIVGVRDVQQRGGRRGGGHLEQRRGAIRLQNSHLRMQVQR
jgi:hypothetical protein